MAKQLRFRFFKQIYLFKFRVGFSLLCLFFLVLFCVLGVWQLHRYHYKQELLAAFEQREAAPPTSLSQLVNYVQFQSAKVDGTYLNQFTMLVQGRFYKSQLGYEVLTPLQIPGEKKLLLVDRGWIAQPADQSLPHIAEVNDAQHIVGYIKLLNEYQFILGKNILQPTQTPLVMQKINIDEISQYTHQEFFPFVMRLSASQPYGYIRDWTITSVDPQRHVGYAIQWFLMAMVLFIAYFCFCCEREKKND